MKILKVAFKNLNSLVGSREIDLESGPLANAGIFAITGPTGAGKSTILDAITLALYGRAARYGTTTNPVDMMSRQTGDSSAEVVFEVPAGRFRAAWHLHRAHGKFDGKLQSPKRHLYEIVGVEDRPIADKANDVKQKIEELIGLDAERFLRSALLAQNEFARFLKASADQRATLLESLTGTEIYSRLGELAHRTLTDRERELKTELDRLGDISLMPNEQRDETNAAIQNHESESKQIEQQIDGTQHEITRGDRFVELSTQHVALEQARETLLREFEVFDSSRKSLTAHRKASELSSELQRFDQLEEDSLRLQTEHQLVKQASHQSLVELRSGIEAAVAIAQRESKKLQVDIEAGEKQETAFRKSISEIESWLETHQADAEIADSLPEITASIEKLAAARNRLNDASESGKQLTTRKEAATKNETQFQKSLTAAKSSVAESRQRIEETQKIFGETGKGKTILQIENEINGLRDLLQRLRELRQLEEVSNEAASDLESLKTTVAKVSDELTTAVVNHKSLSKETQQQRELVDACKLAFDRLQLIASLQDHRDELKPDEECPLCGSLEHPLANQHPVTNSAKKEEGARLAKAEAAFKRLNESERLAERLVDKLTVRKTEKERTLQTRQKAFDEAHLKLTGTAAQIAVKNPTQQSIDQRISDEIAQKSKLEKQVTRLRQINDEIAAAEKEFAKAESDQRACEIELENCRKQLKEVSEEESALADKIVAVNKSIESHRAELAKQIEPLGKPLSDADGEAALRDSLIKRVAEHRKKIDQLRESGDELRSLGSQLEKLRQEKTNTATALKKQIARRDDDLVRETKPDDALAKQFVKDWNTLEETETHLQSLRSFADAAYAKSLTSANSLDETKQRSKSAKESLLEKVEKSSFEDVDALRAALLTHESAQQIEERQKELDARKSRNEGELATIKRSMDELTEANVSRGESLDKKKSELSEAKQSLSKLKDELAKLRNELKVDDANRKLHDELGREFKEQQRQLETWRQLKSLIGSANGSRFRRFAQGLSLDILVRLANQHLKNLSDRYLLQRVDGEQLDMEICDMHQGGTRRPMASLSGGESFIASLALALGLSDLAGRNVRIDSLFIDEGFGALDPETLDVAVAALEGLQSANKTIGVISHVELLKERITTQIQVVPRGGGVSELHIVS